MIRTLLTCIIISVVSLIANAGLFGSDAPLISEADILKSYQSQYKAKKTDKVIKTSPAAKIEKPVEAMSVRKAASSAVAGDSSKESSRIQREKKSDGAQNDAFLKRNKRLIARNKSSPVESGQPNKPVTKRFSFKRRESSPSFAIESSKKEPIWRRRGRVQPTAVLPSKSMLPLLSIESKRVKSMALCLVIGTTLLPNLRETVHDAVLYTICRLGEIGQDSVEGCWGILQRTLALPALLSSMRRGWGGDEGVSSVLEEHSVAVDREMQSDVLWNIAMEVYHTAVHTPSIDGMNSNDDSDNEADIGMNGEVEESVRAVETHLKQHLHALEDIVGSRQREVLEHLTRVRSQGGGYEDKDKEGSDVQRLVGACEGEIRKQISHGLPYVYYYRAYTTRKYAPSPPLGRASSGDRSGRAGSRSDSQVMRDVQRKLVEIAEEQEQLWRVVHGLYKRNESTGSTDGSSDGSGDDSSDNNDDRSGSDIEAFESKLALLLHKYNDVEIVLSSMIRDAANVRQLKYDGESKVQTLVGKYNYIEIVLSSLIREQALLHQYSYEQGGSAKRVGREGGGSADSDGQQEEGEEDDEEEEKEYITSDEYALDQTRLRAAISSREGELKIIMDTVQSFARDLKEVVAFVNEIEQE